MASDHPSQPEVPEMDEFDVMWAEQIERDPNICESKDINPSQPGWEITLHLFDEDPEKGETQLTKDFNTLHSLESVGVLTVKYISKKGDNRIILNHQENSPLEHFIHDHRQLFDRYAPLIKAPISARREAGIKDEPETIRPPIAVSIPVKDDTVAKISLHAREETQKILLETKPQPTLRKSAKKKESGRQKIEQFQFDSIITTIPFNHPQQQQIRQSLQSACEEENLEYEEESDTSHYDITMSKKDGVIYGHMRQKNVSALFNIHALHKLALTLF